jgi:hypothetical protein
LQQIAIFSHKLCYGKNIKSEMDIKSIGLCVATILIKVWADFNLSNVGVVVAIIAGISTIIYNVYRMYKEIKTK